MEQSILTSTKKILGISEDYVAFDLDIITHINTALSILTQIGIGPVEGFAIEDADTEWEEFIGDDKRFISIRSYVYLKVRQLFDPPTTSYLIDAVEKQIRELEWRLSSNRESTAWRDPNPIVVDIEVDPL